jgi:hypothetical protein
VNPVNQLFFHTEQLIVLGYALTTLESTRFELTGIDADGKIVPIIFLGKVVHHVN